jgi:hypothetical protein
MIAQKTFLANTLGFDHPNETGILHIGQLSDSARTRLLTACLERTIPAFMKGQNVGGAIKSVDINYHPDLNMDGDMDAYWTEAVEMDSACLSPLIEGWGHLLSLKQGCFEFLTCSFMSAHTDESRHLDAQIGSLVMVLDAPKGCTILTNWGTQTPVVKGQIVLLADEFLHAAYPIEKGSALQPDYDQQDIARKCMSFLLINSYDLPQLA